MTRRKTTQHKMGKDLKRHSPYMKRYSTSLVSSKIQIAATTICQGTSTKMAKIQEQQQQWYRAGKDPMHLEPSHPLLGNTQRISSFGTWFGNFTWSLYTFTTLVGIYNQKKKKWPQTCTQMFIVHRNLTHT
jgi:hypothetical protein